MKQTNGLLKQMNNKYDGESDIIKSIIKIIYCEFWWV